MISFLFVAFFAVCDGHGGESHDAPKSDYSLAFLISGAVATTTLFGPALLFFCQMLNFAADPFSPKFIAAGNALASGALIYVALVHIVSDGHAQFADAGWSEALAHAAVIASFFAGVVFIAVLMSVSSRWRKQSQSDELLPSVDTIPSVETKRTLANVSLIAMLSFMLHNIGEGLVTFVTAMQDAQIGIGAAIAIGLHNLVEGLAISVPVFQATGSRWKAILAAFVSAVFKPIGAVIAYAIMTSGAQLSPVVVGRRFVSVRGGHRDGLA